MQLLGCTNFLSFFLERRKNIKRTSFCDTRSLRSSRDLLLELFSAALCNNADEHFIGRQAGEWAMLYHQLDALMQAAWELNGAKDTNPVMLCVGE